MQYTLTDHARTVLAERRIRTEWLEHLLEAPEHVWPDGEDEELRHHVGRIAEHGNRVLRIIVNMTVEPPRIVTAYFDRSLRNRL